MFPIKISNTLTKAWVNAVTYAHNVIVNRRLTADDITAIRSLSLPWKLLWNIKAFAFCNKVI